MIRSLRGQLQAIMSDAAVIDVQGVGYEVFVPPHLLRTWTEGQVVFCHVYTVVREDAWQLYGFAHSADRALFALLLSVSGVGPRTALLVMDHGASAVIKALQQADVGFFQAIPRLGKKTAQKMVVELQHKVGGDASSLFVPLSVVARDVAEALANMGYSGPAVQSVLTRLPTDYEVATALKWAIQELKSQA